MCQINDTLAVGAAAPWTAVPTTTSNWWQPDLPVTRGWSCTGSGEARNIRLYRMKKSFMRGLHFMLSPPKDTDIVLNAQS